MTFLWIVFVLCFNSVIVNGQNLQVVNVTDPNWYFTEWNWFIVTGDSSYAQSTNPGSYFKVGFTGTSFSLALNTTTSPTFSFTTLRYSIDLAPYQEMTLPAASNDGWTTLASNLNDGNHEIILYIKNSLQTEDRWLYGPVDRVRIQGLGLDAGSTTLPPTLRPQRMMVYWDSIGEGVEVLGGGNGDLADNDGTSTWAMALATALESEISVVAFGAQGYSVYGVGNVPPLFTPGNDVESAWDKFDVDHYRFEPGQVAALQPDYVFCGHGTNDYGRGDLNVTANALGWLYAMRDVAPSSTIFLVIPFGNFPVQAADIQNAYAVYQQKTNDKNAFLIDLGLEAAIGLNGSPAGGSLYSYDSIHPLWYRTGQLGAALAAAAMKAMNGA